MYHVIIVEDDPMVAAINRQYLASDPHFQLDQCFSNGADALAYLKEHPADLGIIDYYMPVMNGNEFLHALHVNHLHLSIIMITAASSAEEVTKVLSQGVLDYIVKPFTFDRFRQALQKFLHLRSYSREESEHLSQDQIDRMLSGRSPLDGPAPDNGVKGIQAQTLDMLRTWLGEHPDSYLTSDEVAKQVHLSRITVRRYLSHLLENHEIISRMDYSTGGRPSLRYCAASHRTPSPDHEPS